MYTLAGRIKDTGYNKISESSWDLNYNPEDLLKSNQTHFALVPDGIVECRITGIQLKNLYSNLDGYPTRIHISCRLRLRVKLVS